MTTDSTGGRRASFHAMAEGTPEDWAAIGEHLVEASVELPDRVLLYTRDGDATAAAVAERGLPPHSTLVRRSTLEDVFLHLTGRTLIE